MSITKKKIMINIKSAHYTPSNNDRDPAVIDVFAPENLDSVDATRIDIDYEGVMYLKDGRLFIEYDESELTGMEGAKTQISFDTKATDFVVMNRTGAVKGSLCFEAGSRIECVQDSGEMMLSFVIDTESLTNNINIDGGDLKILYGMEFRGSLVQRSIMHFSVHKA